jgi:hypothetical protein
LHHVIIAVEKATGGKSSNILAKFFKNIYFANLYFCRNIFAEDDQQEERYLRENRRAIVIYQSILYFNNLSTHPKNISELRYTARSSVNSGDMVGRTADIIHVSLSLVVVRSRVILKFLDVVS